MSDSRCIRKGLELKSDKRDLRASTRNITGMNQRQRLIYVFHIKGRFFYSIKSCDLSRLFVFNNDRYFLEFWIGGTHIDSPNLGIIITYGATRPALTKAWC